MSDNSNIVHIISLCESLKNVDDDLKLSRQMYHM